MILCFILFGLIAALAGLLFAKEQLISGLIATLIGLFILGLGFILCDNKIAETKINTLNSVGIEYLSKEDVYNKSQAELDKMYSISTLNDTYYYNITK